MSQRISTNLAIVLCALLLFAEVDFAQEKNPTVYPYGGVPDKSRETNLNFNRAYFIKAKFGEANFRGAKFDGAAHFFQATFDDVAPDEPLFTKPKIKPTGKIK